MSQLQISAHGTATGCAENKQQRRGLFVAILRRRRRVRSGRRQRRVRRRRKGKQHTKKKNNKGFTRTRSKNPNINPLIIVSWRWAGALCSFPAPPYYFHFRGLCFSPGIKLKGITSTYAVRTKQNVRTAEQCRHLAIILSLPRHISDFTHPPAQIPSQNLPF